MEGPLWKCSEWVRKWNARSFSLVGPQLSWQPQEVAAGSEGAASTSKSAACVCVRGAALGRGLRFSLSGVTVFPFVVFLRCGRELLLGAASAELRTRWMQKLQASACCDCGEGRPRTKSVCSDPGTNIQPRAAPCTSPATCGSPPGSPSRAGATSSNSTSNNSSSKLDQCFKLGWHVSVANCSVHEVLPHGESGALRDQQSRNNDGSPVPAEIPSVRVLWTVRYSCSSMEWVAQRTFSDLVEFDLAFRRWMHHQYFSVAVSSMDDDGEHELFRTDNGKSAQPGGAGHILKPHTGTKFSTSCPCGHCPCFLPQLPDVELLYPELVQEGTRWLLTSASNKLLCHSPRNPVDIGAHLRDINVGGVEFSKVVVSFHQGRETLVSQMNAYFERAASMSCFHSFMIRTGSEPRHFLSADLQPTQLSEDPRGMSRVPRLLKTRPSADFPSFPLQKVYARLKPGDILLFNIRSRIAAVQRVVCNCFWDHIGIVTMTRADERLHLLEATQQGVTCLPLRQRLTQYALDGAVVAARIFSWQCDSASTAKLRFKHIIRTLRVFAHEVLGNRYGGIWSSLGSILRHKVFRPRRPFRPPAAAHTPVMPRAHHTLRAAPPSREESDRTTAAQETTALESVDTVGPPSNTSNSIATLDPSPGVDETVAIPRRVAPPPASSPPAQKYFCSNLVAIAFVRMGVLDGVTTAQASCYLPKAFEPGGDVDQHLNSSFLLGPPLLCYATTPKSHVL